MLATRKGAEEVVKSTTSTFITTRQKMRTHAHTHTRTHTHTHTHTLASSLVHDVQQVGKAAAAAGIKNLGLLVLCEI
jgi:hypothetical protein